MCKFQSILLACVVFVCTQPSGASPPGRSSVSSNGKSPSVPLALESRDVEEVSEAATKAQEKEHHLALIKEKAENDFSEKYGKHDDMEYVRNFHKNGASGYDSYETFQNLDKGEYDHKNQEHTENENEDEQDEHEKESFAAEEEKFDDDEESDEGDDNNNTADNDEDDGGGIDEYDEPEQHLQMENEDEPIEVHSSNSTNHPTECTSSVCCANCNLKDINTSIEYPEESNDSDEATEKNGSYSTKRRIIGARVELKPNGYEVYEYPDEGETDPLPRHSDGNHQHSSHPSPTENSLHYYKKKLANEHPKGVVGGGGYESYIVHDEEVDNQDNDNGGQISNINYHHPTLDREPKNEENDLGMHTEDETDYDERTEISPNKDDDEEQHSPDENHELDVDDSLFNNDDEANEDDESGVETEKDEEDDDCCSSGDYDDHSYRNEEHSNRQTNESDPQDLEYDYDDKGHSQDTVTSVTSKGMHKSGKQQNLPASEESDASQNANGGRTEYNDTESNVKSSHSNNDVNGDIVYDYIIDKDLPSVEVEFQD